VRVRRDVHPGGAVDRHRPVMINEAPRPDRPLPPQRQQPPHGYLSDPGDARRGKLSTVVS